MTRTGTKLLELAGLFVVAAGIYHAWGLGAGLVTAGWVLVMYAFRLELD